MPALTITQLCNLSLSRIGARRLASYESDTSTEATSCRLHYDLARDGLLRRHQWDFAKDSKRLSKLPAAVSPKFPAAWQLPADCVRVIGASVDGVDVTNYARHGRLLLTDDFEVLDLEYVSNAVPLSQWDSLFVEALTLRLATKICEDIAQNPAKMAEVSNELEALALPSAQTADAREANSGEGFGLSDLIAQSTLGRMRRRLRGGSLNPYADIP
jgi:hypothetical protein